MFMRNPSRRGSFVNVSSEIRRFRERSISVKFTSLTTAESVILVFSRNERYVSFVNAVIPLSVMPRTAVRSRKVKLVRERMASFATSARGMQRERSLVRSESSRERGDGFLQILREVRKGSVVIDFQGGLVSQKSSFWREERYWKEKSRIGVFFSDKWVRQVRVGGNCSVALFGLQLPSCRRYFNFGKWWR